MSEQAPRILALGAEGTASEEGTIQLNLPNILKPDFSCSSDGSKGLPRLKRAGPIVVAQSDRLPFADHFFDRIIAQSVPVCGLCKNSDNQEECGQTPRTFLGPVYCWIQIMRILADGGEAVIDDMCFVHRPNQSTSFAVHTPVM